MGPVSARDVGAGERRPDDAGPRVDMRTRTAAVDVRTHASVWALAVSYQFCSHILPPSKFDRRISITEEFSNDTRITIGGARFWLSRGECIL